MRFFPSGQRLIVKTDDADFVKRVMLGNVILDRGHRDNGGPFNGEMIYARRNTWKRDGFCARRFGDLKRMSIGRGQQRIFPVESSAPHGADSMHNPFGGQLVCLCDFRVARVASAQRSAFLQ